MTGRHYGLVSQYRTDDADTVFVSLGSAAENIEAAVDYMRERWGAKVGSIHPNVFRPFPDAAIVKALAGKKNVIILERTDEPLAGDNPMGRDIRTALHKALQHESGLPAISADEMPRLFGGVYGLGSRDFRPEHVLGAYEFAVGRRARKDGKTAADGVSFFVVGIDHPYAVKSEEMPSLLPEGAVAVRFHSVGGWGAITTGKNLGAILGDLNDLLYERDKVVDEFGNPKEIIHVSANPKYGSEKKGAPTAYFMVAAPERIRVNCDLRHVTVVLCCDPKAFTHCNPLDGMSEGGCLIWESDETGEEAWERLPLWARQQIVAKKIRVFTLPGFQIARQATDRSDLQLRMQGNAFLGAFFAVSPVLHEFGITKEQFHEVVHKQYVKKFGRLGEAVVASNMEVMTQGFEPRPGDTDRRFVGGRSVHDAWNGAAAGRGGQRRRHRLRVPIPSDPLRPGGAHAADADCFVRPRVPVEVRLPPAGDAVRVARHHGGGQRRHGVEVRRATRDARSTSPRTAPSAWSASPSVRTRRCRTARRISRPFSVPPSPITSPTPASARRCWCRCRKSSAARAS